VPGVRDVHPERRLTRALAWYAGGGGGGAGADAKANATAAVFDFATSSSSAATPPAPSFSAGPAGSVLKRPGRLTTAPTIGLAGRGDADPDGLPPGPSNRALLAAAAPGVAAALDAPALWERGITGAGVRVGIFDTGVRGDHPHIKNIR
jgi:membrane-bound transcription factor site-1 protease